MVIISAIGAFAAVMWLLNRAARRLERHGAYDLPSDSSATRPGLRFFFDYGEGGFGEDGRRQRKTSSR